MNTTSLHFAAVHRVGIRFAAALSGFALALAGCGGAQGELRDRTFTGAEARYRIGPLGRGWTRLHVDDVNDLAWRVGDGGAIVQVNATCDPGSDIPLSALTNHLLAGFTARELRGEELVPLDGREALRTELRARLDGVPRELVLVVLKKDDCVYDFALIANEDSLARARPEFDTFVAGFTTAVSPR